MEQLLLLLGQAFSVSMCSWGKAVCQVMCFNVLESGGRCPLDEIEGILANVLVVVRKGCAYLLSLVLCFMCTSSLRVSAHIHLLFGKLCTHTCISVPRSPPLKTACVMKPASDLCWLYQQRGASVLKAVNMPEGEKSDVLQKYEEHLQVVGVERSYCISLSDDVKKGVILLHTPMKAKMLHHVHMICL